MIKCKKHPDSDFYVAKRVKGIPTHWRCKACNVIYVNNARRKLKKTLVEKAGGQCLKCGYDKCIQALDFHHPNNDKEFSISGNGSTKSLEKAWNEAKKCILLCANCHREEHYNLSVRAEN